MVTKTTTSQDIHLSVFGNPFSCNITTPSFAHVYNSFGFFTPSEGLCKIQSLSFSLSLSLPDSTLSLTAILIFINPRLFAKNKSTQTLVIYSLITEVHLPFSRTKQNITF